MLKPLWFLVKLGLVVAAVTWLAARPGEVEILWNGYLIETTFGFLLAVTLVLVIIVAMLYRLWRNLINMPRVMRRYKAVQAREKGYDAVTRGLVAVAAGDPKMAEKQARRARGLVPDAALTGLLNAQAALLNGDKSRARLEFEALLEDKRGGFFGLRGLMNEALRENDHEQALLLLRTAEGLHPKRGWIVKALFEAETAGKKWIAADQTLTKAIRLKMFDRETGNRYRQALLVARAQDGLDKGMTAQALPLAKQAFRLDAGFLPAALLYARLLVKTGNRRKAVGVIEESWSRAPHPILADLWTQLAPAPRGKTEDDKKRDRLNWFKRLYGTASFRPESNALMGKAAMEMKLYAEARDWLKAAGAYRQLARLEQLDGRHAAAAQEWLERAAEARPDPQWVCEECACVVPEWKPLCPNCRTFNSIDWRIPDMTLRLTHDSRYTQPANETGFIEPPAGAV